MRVAVEWRGEPPSPGAPAGAGSFWIGERRVDVREVVDRWPSGDHQYVKVESEDHSLYILRNDFSEGTWELIAHLSPDAEALLAGLIRDRSERPN